MIIFRYLIRQILGTATALTFVLLLVIISGRFIKYLGSVASGEMAANILSQLMLYRMPGFLELILPLGFFISILLVYGRMYADSEMVVLFAGGVSRNKICAYTVIIALIVAVLMVIVSFILVPASTKKFEQIWEDPNNFRGLSTLIEGRFQDNKGTSWISYTDALSPDKSNLGLVFLTHPITKDVKKEVLVIAKSGRVLEQQKGRYLELNNGFRYEGNVCELDYQVTQFDQYGQRIDIAQQEVAATLQPEARSIRELWQSPAIEDQAVLHWRIGVPISVLIMSIFGFAMSKTDHRKGHFIKMLPAIVFYVLYVFLMSAGKNYLAEEKVPLWLGLWWLHLLFLIVTAGVYFAPQWLQLWRKIFYTIHPVHS